MNDKEKKEYDAVADPKDTKLNEEEQKIFDGIVNNEEQKLFNEIVNNAKNQKIDKKIEKSILVKISEMIVPPEAEYHEGIARQIKIRNMLLILLWITIIIIIIYYTYKIKGVSALLEDCDYKQICRSALCITGISL